MPVPFASPTKEVLVSRVKDFEEIIAIGSLTNRVALSSLTVLGSDQNDYGVPEKAVANYFLSKKVVAEVTSLSADFMKLREKVHTNPQVGY